MHNETLTEIAIIVGSLSFAWGFIWAVFSLIAAGSI